jgi:hypothetical protein
VIRVAKGKKKGKSRRSEAVDNIEYATLRSAGELSDIQHLLIAMLEVLREVRDALKVNAPN